MLDLIDRDEKKACEILLLLADAERLAGQGVEAVNTLREAEAIGRARGFGEIVARTTLACHDVVRDNAGADESLYRRMESALELLPLGDTPLRARLLGAISLTSFLWKPSAERLAMCDEATAMARRLGDPETVARVLHLTHFMIIGSRPAQVLDCGNRGIVNARIAAS